MFPLNTAPPAPPTPQMLPRNCIFNDTKCHPILNPTLSWNILFISVSCSNTMVRRLDYRSLSFLENMHSTPLGSCIVFLSAPPRAHPLPVAAACLFLKCQLCYPIPCSAVTSHFLLGVREERGAGGPVDYGRPHCCSF